MKYKNFFIRKLEIGDTEKIKTCLINIEGELSTELFVAPTIDYINTIISGYGYSAGIFIKDLLVGFASVVFPRLGKSNLGYCINMTDEALLSVAQLEHIYLLPHFRGKGLAEKLVKFLIAKLESQYTILLSTISPQNISSLSLAFNFDLRIVSFANIYKVNRFIMRRDLTHKTIKYKEGAIEISALDINRIVQLLKSDYVGINFGFNKSTLIFRQEM